MFYQNRKTGVCPLTSSPKYKESADALLPTYGERVDAVVHKIFYDNEGHYLDRKSDGSASPLFTELQARYGRAGAIQVMHVIFTDKFIDKHGDWRAAGTEPDLAAVLAFLNRKDDGSKPFDRNDYYSVRDRIIEEFGLKKLESGVWAGGVHFIEEIQDWLQMNGVTKVRVHATATSNPAVRKFSFPSVAGRRTSAAESAHSTGQRRIDLPFSNDQRFTSARDAEKLSALEAQRGRIQAQLDDKETSRNGAKVAVLEKMLENTAKLIEDIEESIRDSKTGFLNPSTFVPVSQFIGHSDFENGNDAEMFSPLNVLLNDTLFSIIESSAGTGERPAMPDLSDFDTSDKYKTLRGRGITTEDLTEMLRPMVTSLQAYWDNGATVIPGLVTAGRDVRGVRIVSVMPATIIGADGRVRIHDFRIRRVSRALNSLTPGKLDRAAVRQQLSRMQALQMRSSHTHPVFDGMEESILYRWTSSNLMSDFILRQNGIKPGGRQVSVMAFQADKSGNLSGVGTENYEPGLYDEAFNPDTNSNISRERFMQSIRNVESVLPLPEGMVSNPERDEARYAFNLSEESYDELSKQVGTIIAAEVVELSSQISREQRADTPNAFHLQNLEGRRDTLRRLESIVQKGDAWLTSLKVQHLSDTLLSDLTKHKDAFSEAVKIGDTRLRLQEMERLLEASRKLSSLVDFLGRAVAAAESEGSLPADSALRQRVKGMQSALDEIHHHYIREAIPIVITVFAPDLGRLERHYEQRRLQLEPKLRSLDEKIATLREGKDLPARSRIADKLKTWFSRSAMERTELEEGATDEERERIKTIEMLEKRRALLVLQMSFGLKVEDDGTLTRGEDGKAVLDIASIEQFFTGAANLSQEFYAGFRESVPFIAGLAGDQFIASASSDDYSVSAFAQFLKDAWSSAGAEYMNRMEAMGAETRIRAYSSGKTVEQMNKPLIEEVERVYYQDGTRRTKTEVRFVHPSSEEYTQVFTEYAAQYRDMQKAISDMRARIASAVPSERPALKGERNRLLEEAAALRDSHEEWLIQHTSLPYTDKFYQAKAMIPKEVRRELASLYEEREDLRAMVEAGYDEEDLNRVAEIDFEIRQRRNAAFPNPKDLQRYNELNAEIYESVDNTEAFEREREKKRIEYATNPAKFKRWLDNNEILKPTSEWFTEVERLYDSIKAIFDEITPGSSADPEMDRIYAQRKKLLSPYWRENAYDVRFLPDEVKEAIDGLEAELQEHLKNKGKTDMPESVADAYNSLRDQLDSIRVKRANPYYAKDYRLRTAALNGKLSLLREADAKLNEALNSNNTPTALLKDLRLNQLDAQRQFSAEEQEFQAWYNTEHQDDYVSVLTEPIAKEPRPKSRNIISFPHPDVAARYTERKPSSRWSLRKVRDEIVNPAYEETEDGLPLPRGLVREGDKNSARYGILPGHENSRFINSRYKELLKDKDAFEFYNWLLSTYFSEQRSAFGERRLGYMLPGMSKSKEENFMRDGIKGMVGNGLAEWVDRNRASSALDDLSGSYGSNGREVKFDMNRQLPSNLQSRDGISSVMRWMYEAEVNKAMNDARPVADAMLEIMQDQKVRLAEMNQSDGSVQKRMREIEEHISQLSFERRKHISGQYNATENKRMKKVLTVAFSAISFARMGFDIASQMKNLFAGNIQNFLGARAGKGLSPYSQRNHMNAKRMLYGTTMPALLQDYGKMSGLSMETKRFRRFNPSQVNLGEEYYEIAAASRGRRAAAAATNFMGLAHGVQGLGNSEIDLTVYLAVLDANRFRVMETVDRKRQHKKDEAGNPMWVTGNEVFTEDELGQIVYRDDVEFTADDEKRLRNTIYSEVRASQGNYAKVDQSKIESGMLGSLLYFYKKYLVPTVRNRVGGAGSNWEEGGVRVGFYRAMGDVFAHYGFKAGMAQLLVSGASQKLARKLGAGAVNEYYLEKSARTSRELMIATLLIMFATSLTKYLEDDEEDIGIVKGNLIRMVWGVKKETTSMIPLPIIGGLGDYIRSFGNISTAVADAEKAIKMVTHLAEFGITQVAGKPEDSAFYQSIYNDAYYKRKSGRWAAGDPKLYKDLVDLTGVRNFMDLLKPGYKLQVMKQGM